MANVGSSYYADFAAPAEAGDGTSGNYVPGETVTGVGGTFATAVVLTVVKTRLRPDSATSRLRRLRRRGRRHRLDHQRRHRQAARGTCQVTGAPSSASLPSTGPASSASTRPTCPRSRSSSPPASPAPPSPPTPTFSPATSPPSATIPSCRQPLSPPPPAAFPAPPARWSTSPGRRPAAPSGTDNFAALTAWLNAFNASAAANTTSGFAVAHLPGGIYGVFSGTGLPKITRGGTIRGDGRDTSVIQMTAATWRLHPRPQEPLPDWRQLPSTARPSRSPLPNRLEIADLWLAGNRTATTKLDGIRFLKSLLQRRSLEPPLLQPRPRHRLRHPRRPDARLLARVCGPRSRAVFLRRRRPAGDRPRRHCAQHLQRVDAAKRHHRFPMGVGLALKRVQPPVWSISAARSTATARPSSPAISSRSARRTGRLRQKILFLAPQLITPAPGTPLATYGTTRGSIPRYVQVLHGRVSSAPAPATASW